MLGKGLPNGGILYGDAKIRNVRAEKRGMGGNDLRLWCVRSGRDYLEIIYGNVLYSQIDEASIGMGITLVEELTFDEFTGTRHNAGRNGMLRDAPEGYADYLDAFCRGDCRAFAHYSEKSEYIVLAGNISIAGPDERLALPENRKCRFYAFISHVNGGSDEKWANRLRRWVAGYRMPAEYISAPEDPVAEGEKPAPPKRFEVTASGRVSRGAASASAKYLIVVCSPRAAASPLVDGDVRGFVEAGMEDCIIPFIISGEPDGNDETRCYPPSLSGDFTGITLSDGTREEALVRIISRLLRVKYSRLYGRHLRARVRFMRQVLAVAAAVLMTAASLAAWAVSAEMEAARRLREAEGFVGFLAEEMSDESVPSEIRALIGARVRDYRGEHGTAPLDEMKNKEMKNEKE